MPKNKVAGAGADASNSSKGSSAIHRSISACNRCRSRKTKCDQLFPACTSCAKAGVECVGVDAATGREIPRSYVSHLEERIKELEAQLQPREETRKRKQQSPPPTGAHIRPDIENLVTDTVQPSSFLGSSSGISFAKLMFAAVKVSSKENLPERAATFRGRMPVHEEAEPPISAALQRIKPRPPPAPLPDRETAQELIETYFQQSNPQHPILHRHGFMERFDSVYRDQKADPPSLYFLNMVFAIATGMRSDTKSMPEQYHSAAIQHMDSLFSTTNRLDGLKGVLLLALYSLMRPASPGVWYVLGSAMRMAIDLGLHNESPQIARLDALTLDERRRLWWSTYSLDRQVCLYLGRPFGISDDAIKVPYPEDVDDKLISKDGIMKDHPLANQKSSRTIARHLFRLRELQSEIQCILYQQSEIPRKFNTLEEWRRDMEARLNEWTVSVPKNKDDTNCGYNMGFIDLNYQQTRLLLYGLSPAVPEPTTEAYLVIADSGNRIIKAYRQLYKEKKINYTWVACHNLFMASTSYLCALWHCDEVRQRTAMDEIDWNTRACATVLDSMQDQCPAALGCRDVFLNLANATVQLCNDHRGDNRAGKRAKTEREWSRKELQLEPVKHALPASLANIVHSQIIPPEPTQPPIPFSSAETVVHGMGPPVHYQEHDFSPPSHSPVSHHSSHLSPSSAGMQSPLAGMMMQNNVDQVMRTAEQLNWDHGGGGDDQLDDGMGSKVFELISGVGGGDIWNSYDFNGDPNVSNGFFGDAANMNMGMGNVGFMSSGPVPEYGAGGYNPFPGGF